MSLMRAENLIPILQASSGIFAGMNLGISVCAAPGLFEVKSPLPGWKLLYKRASKIAIGCILCSGTAGVLAFMDRGMTKDDAGLLVAAGIALCIMPYTIITMVPINNALFSIEDKEAEREPKVTEVKELIESWSQKHWARTVAGCLVFGIAVFKIGFK